MRAIILAVASLLLLVFLTGILVILSDVYGKIAPHAYEVGAINIQATPTLDATALTQKQLKQQVDKLQRENSLPWVIWTAISGFCGTILAAAAALLVAWLGWQQWLGNRRDEQDKRAEERFQAVVKDLGSESLAARADAAITLRTFLYSGYERFYRQIFDLTVANLGLRNYPATPAVREYPPPLVRAFVTVFRESFRCARDLLQQEPQFSPESLNATDICLDNADLAGADLKDAWMPGASLVKATLKSTDLSRANLRGAHLTEANLTEAVLTNATLIDTDLSRAILKDADLKDADLSRAILIEADLTDAVLFRTVLLGTNLEVVKSLTGAKIHSAIGLNQAQCDYCRSKGASVKNIIEISASSSA